ncbi:MAG: GTP 3',8-cyclase MoaA [Lamprobacter sp.]|uniref:GTP 3',8-cyclase MoaA n=1 Tax=Lamprobacter sp. TaxID=3100796 RepID=UPI002B25F1A4|nr:GTP 3',8-cyclase MoaA [Lamprobacter sp.]MEA3642217.1 GTP 3',8-cyclase MoaA [Lamprobacter sp.]
MSTERPALIDRFGRHVTYVRLSVTDRCDLRCVYCMAEDMAFLPRAQVLTLEEMARLGRCFTELGVTKLRVTGGEPLVRRDVMTLFEALGALPGLKELTLTTNGTQLPRFAKPLKAAGVNRINISLDSLRPERFRAITRKGHLEQVLAGIEAARAAGFDRIKLNSVVLKHRNHDEVSDLVAFAIARGLDISFIEEMPLGVIGDHDRAEAFYSSEQIRADLSKHLELIASAEHSGGPSRYWRVAGVDTRIGFISPQSHNFCGSCNRVRVTAEGRLLLCLGQEHSMDLRRVLRANPLDDEAVKRALIQSMAIKPEGHDFDLEAKPIIFRHMNATGG